MAKYYFQTPNPDLPAITKRLVLWFKQNHYDVDSVDDDMACLIQAKKTGNIRTLTGTNVAFTLKLYTSDSPDEFVCETATGKWTANIAGAATTALFTGGFTLLTGALGAAWLVKVERDIVDFMESTLKFRKLRTDDKTAADPSSLPSRPPDAQPPAPPATQSPEQKAQARLSAELQSLKDARDNGVLDDGEYATKSQQLNERFTDYLITFTLEDRAVNLHDALANGIIDKDVFDEKHAALKQAVTADILHARANAAAMERKDKLRAARDAGILSEEEYAAKLKALG